MRLSSDEVKAKVAAYLEKHLPNMELVSVYQKSNHPDDWYLHMVVAKYKGKEEFACWTCYNEQTDSMNYGHYNISLETTADILYEHFNDINRKE